MKNVFMAGVFITLLFCGSPSLSWATSSHTVETVQQKQKIAGVVVDQNGEPIIGANILQKGTSNGTITDINGQFILNCPIGNSTDDILHRILATNSKGNCKYENCFA